MSAITLPHYSGPIPIERGWKAQGKPIPDSQPIDCVVLGVESSGLQWMARVLYLHPDLHHVFHQSYPLREPRNLPIRDQVNRHIKHLRKFENRESNPNPPMVVMLRDRHCSERSRIKRNFIRKSGPRKLALEQLWRDVLGWEGQVLFVSYEGLVEHKHLYLQFILKELELEPQVFPWEEVIYLDQNRKHIRG